MKKFYTLFLLLIPLLFITCKRDEKIAPLKLLELAQVEGALPEWAVEALDNIPSVPVDPKGVILSDGTTLENFIKNKTSASYNKSIKGRTSNLTPLQLKNEIIGNMLSKGIECVAKKDYSA